METEQVVLADEKEQETSSCRKQMIAQVEQQPELNVSEILVDKVMSSTPFQYNQMDSSIDILGLHATVLKAQSSYSTNTTSGATESSKKKQVFLDTVKEASTGFNCNMQQSEANVDVTESSNITTRTNTKAKKSLIGIRRQKNGRYGAVIRDPIRHKQVWLGTFDTVEQASKAIISKKSEFDEKLSLQGNCKENKPKGNKKQKINQVSNSNLDAACESQERSSEVSVDKVKSTTCFQDNHMDSSIDILGLQATELKAQSSNSTNNTTTAPESIKEADGKEPPFIREISRVELMANVRVTESSGATTSINPNAKISLIGIRKQSSGRYAAVITDRIRHKKVWLGTFDTIEEASKAYFSKKSEFDEKLSLLGNCTKKPKKNDDHIQPKSPVVAPSSVPNDQTSNTTSVGRTTHIIGVHKRKTSGKYTSEITNPISEKKIWLGTFGTAEEASQAYQSKKLEFQKIVKEKQQQQCNDNQAHDSKQDDKEKLVNVNKEGNENVNCGWLSPESAGGSETEQGILAEEKEDEETSSRKQKKTQMLHSDDSDAATREGQEKRSSSVEQPQLERDVSKSFVDKVKSTTPFQYNQMNGSVAILGLPVTEVKAQNSNSTHSTATAAESSKKAKGKKPFIREISRVELMANVHVTESSNSTTINPKAKRSLIGIRSQKNGRYGAFIKDPIRHKQVWLGTFDTVEQASEAYFSKKTEFEKLSLQGNDKNRPKKNSHHIQPESPDAASLSLPNNQTLNTSSVGTDSHKATHVVGVNKSKTTGKYTSEITNPVTKKKIWLGTFGTAEEASQAYQSKKLEFQKLVKAKRQQQCSNEQTHDSKQDGKEKLGNVKQHGHENVNCELFQPELAGGSETEQVVLSEDKEETGSKRQMITQVIHSDGSDAATREGQERRSLSVEQEPECDVSEMFVDEVKSSTPFQHNQMESSIAISGLHATELKAQNAYSTNSTTAAESSNQADGKKPFIREISQVELTANVHVTESSNTTSTNPKAKRSLIGIRRQKNGRYGAVIRDPFRHKQVWLGTFDTVEEASEAIISKKAEFEKLSLQGNKEKRPKRNSSQIQPESPDGSSLSMPNNQTSNAASVGIDSHKTTRIVGVNKSKTTGKYTSEITNPINKKKIWLGTFATAEEASQAYQSKKLEFQKLVKAKQQQQCINKQTCSKQDAKEKLVSVKQEHEDVDCQQFQPESTGGLEFDLPISNLSTGGTDQMIDSHNIGIAREDFHAYQFKKFDFQSSKNVELQSDMPTDAKQQGQEDEDLSMEQWVQLPGDREVKFSQKLGLPIIDNYGSLLGEFSSLDDDLSICKVCST